MDDTSVFLICSISFMIPALVVLIGALYYYITIKKFNKDGIVTYGEIVSYKYGSYDSRYDLPNLMFDNLYVKFNLDGKEHTGVIYTMLPSKKQLEKNVQLEARKKLKY